MASALNCEWEILAIENASNVDTFVDSISILLRILDNVIREPQNDKYRTIRLENKIVKEKLLSLNGIRPLLEKIGFVEVDGTLNLPANALIATVRKYRNQINERLECIKNGSTSQPIAGTSSQVKKPTEAGIGKAKPTRIIPLKSFQQRTTFDKVIPFQNAFLKHLEDRSDEVQQYEDDRLQYYGRKMIPLRTLTENAIKRMRTIQKLQKDPAKAKEIRDPCLEDWLLVELVKWFKEKFFTWVHTLPCKVCDRSETRPTGSIIEDGVRVEVSTCCNTQTKFYRYNDIAQLLLTRKGRCGEYANCFTFLCRCLGYEARLVQATFDHVWTEVFSVSRKRWIHIDPSDNVVDAPLMYQQGWKRNVDYVIAFSHDDVQDVTWRYTSDHKETLKKRQKCTETELLKTIFLLKEKRQQNCSAARKLYLKKQCINEVIELMVERQPSEHEKKGRSSGSLSWRLTRGEEQQCASNNFFVFNTSELETKLKQFNLRYSSSKDIYERFWRNGAKVEIAETSKAWQSCAYRWENIFRKEERDWRMAYLARTEDTAKAEIEWKFDFSDRQLKIKSASLKFGTNTFESGQIKVQIMHKGTPLQGIENVQGLDSFTICVQLTGGNGDHAWQHTQLFRQSISTTDEFPFELQITFH